jgi:AcrR family transcriptional regulator
VTTVLRAEKDRERRKRTRRALLDAAERVFTRVGYHHTRVSEIVAEAGCGQGTFYRHFETRREVFVTLFDGLVEALVGDFRGMSAPAPSSLEEYRDASLAALRRMLVTLQDHRAIALLFLREGPSIDPEIEARLDGVYDRFAGIAAFYLEHAIALGFARPCDAQLVGQALVGIGLRLLQGWLRSPPDEAERSRTEEGIREVVDLAFFGFGLSRTDRAGDRT